MDLRALVALVALAPLGASLPGAADPWAGTASQNGAANRMSTAAESPSVLPARAPERPKPAPPGTARWQAPVWPVRTLRPVALPDRDWLPGHRGVDLRAELGAPVHAAGAGRVTFAGTLAGRGVVVVDHGWLRTTYEPVSAGIGVGARVRRGDQIGTVTEGTGHCGSGQCLHWGLRHGRDYLDPMLLIGSTSAWLRPW